MKTNQVLTLNNSRYILLELPFVGRLDYLDELLLELLEKEYIPIIPHPERYIDYKKEDFIKWSKLGILFQGNIESLFGGYGKRSKNKLESLLKCHLISFMGSDIHDCSYFTYERYIKVKLEELLDDKDMVLDLIDKNIEKVIKNEEIKPYELILEKKKFYLFNK